MANKSFTFTTFKGNVDKVLHEKDKDYTIIHHDNLAQAKILAKEWAKARGHTSLYYLSSIKEDAEILQEIFSFTPKPKHNLQYNSEMKTFSGHYNGFPIKPTSPKGLYKRLITVHGLNDAKASDVVGRAQHGETSPHDPAQHTVAGHTAMALHHSIMAAKYHEAAGGKGKLAIQSASERDKHLGYADQHMEHAKTLEHKAPSIINRLRGKSAIPTPAIQHQVDQNRAAIVHHMSKITGNTADLEKSDSEKHYKSGDVKHSEPDTNPKLGPYPDRTYSISDPRKKATLPNTPLKMKPNEIHKESEINEAAPKLKYHGESEMFYGSYKGVQIKPQKDKDLLKVFTDLFGYDPNRASEIINKTKQPQEAKEIIDKHLKFMNHWKKKADHFGKSDKAAGKKKQKAFLKGVKFHKMKIKSLDPDNHLGTFKEDIEPILTELIAEGIGYDAFVVHLVETNQLTQIPDDLLETIEDWWAKQTDRKVIEKIMAAPIKEIAFVVEPKAEEEDTNDAAMKYINFARRNRMYRDDNMVDEAYALQVIEQLRPLFTKDEIKTIMTTEGAFEDSIKARLDYWFKNSHLNEQRLVRVRRTVSQGGLKGLFEGKHQLKDYPNHQEHEIKIAKEDLNDLLKAGFSQAEVDSIVQAASGTISEGVSRAHFQSAVNHINTSPPEHRQALTDAHSTIFKTMHPGFKPHKFADAVSKEKQYNEKASLPKLTRKDFEHVAQHLKHAEPGAVKDHLVQHYLNIGHRSNPNFDRARFLKASSHEDVHNESEVKKKKAISWNPPEVQAKAAKHKKEQKMFNSAKREINRLKKQGK